MMDWELMRNCSKTVFVSTFVSKIKALFRAILCTWTKVRVVTETAGCRSLKDVREEEKHGAQPEGRGSSESIDG